MAKAKSSTGTIEPGFWLAAVLPPKAATLRCFVGKVQAVDQFGVRLTLMDWMVSAPMGDDLFIPWASLQSALVATPDHDLEGFIEQAIEWQRRMDADPNGPEIPMP